MKLLFDHNLSPHLVKKLADLYPGSNRVYHLELDRSPDHAIREYAREHEFAIVSRDADFSELTIMLGFPPKVVWIRRGNCTTKEVEEMLRLYHQKIQRLAKDASVGVLAIF